MCGILIFQIHTAVDMDVALANRDCVSISDKAAIEAGDMKIFTPFLKMLVAWESLVGSDEDIL
jgi:hypothetical protein